MGLKTIWDGLDLPPIGCEVQIHLSSYNAWVRHVVASISLRGDLDGNPALHRIDINVTGSDDPRSSTNSRLLMDVRPLTWREPCKTQ